MFFNPIKIGRGFKALADAWKYNLNGDAERLAVIKKVLKEHPEIQEALLVEGAVRLVPKIRQARMATVQAKSPLSPHSAAHVARKVSGGTGTGRKPIYERAVELRRIDEAKIEAFDKIVEMLDHFKVGDKKLGDCTRSDLLRAARELESQSEEMQTRAAFYKSLADIVGNKTVRDASHRGEIVGLLTTTFKAA